MNEVWSRFCFYITSSCSVDMSSHKPVMWGKLSIHIYTAVNPSFGYCSDILLYFIKKKGTDENYLLLTVLLYWEKNTAAIPHSKVHTQTILHNYLLSLSFQANRRLWFITSKMYWFKLTLAVNPLIPFQLTIEGLWDSSSLWVISEINITISSLDPWGHRVTGLSGSDCDAKKPITGYPV